MYKLVVGNLLNYFLKVNNLNFLVFLIILVLQSCNGQINNNYAKISNHIDSIKDVEMIEALITKTSTRFKYFKVNEKLNFSNIQCNRICDSLKIKPWAKADFDNNGLTDILVIGHLYQHSVICIMDNGNNNYAIKPITNRIFQECTFPIIETNTIKYYFQSYPEIGNRAEALKLLNITLLYKFGAFIEANPNPQKYTLKKIEYSTTGCYGHCPVFNLTINNNRSATLLAIRFNEIKNKEMNGNFKTDITKDKFEEIIDLLNYIDFENLKDHYAVNWTDDQSCTLKITYDNGKTKSISDYGLIGTFGLNRVYELLFELRENQEWLK